MTNQLSEAQRNIIGEKVIDLANLTAIALVVSQILNETIKPFALAAGIISYGLFFLLAVRTMKGSNELQ